MSKKGIAYIVVFLVFAVACTNRDKFDIDTTEIEVEVSIKRLDQEIFEVDPGGVDKALPDLIDTYGEFFELYSQRIILLGSPYEQDFSEKLTGFITDYTMNKVYTEVMEIFPDLTGLEASLEEAFKRYRYYFPEKKIPAIYTYIGGFNQSIVLSDSIIGVGTDKFLGKDCAFYDRLRIANYLQKNMSPENIPADVLKAWASSEYVYNDSIDNLVNNMIYQGKLQYFLDAMFPDVSDSLKIGFTGNEIRWCVQNEKQMWDYLIEKKLLFTTDYMVINQHINSAPFTPGFPRESPGRASVWLGWQIVRKYMNRKQDVSLKELMLDDDYQKILSESRYEP